jgi:hypothetical protein
MPLADACDAFASLYPPPFSPPRFPMPLSLPGRRRFIFSLSFRRHAAAAAFTRQLFSLFRRRCFAVFADMPQRDCFRRCH